jgi:hypothetical protein
MSHSIKIILNYSQVKYTQLVQSTAKVTYCTIKMQTLSDSSIVMKWIKSFGFDKIQKLFSFIIRTPANECNQVADSFLFEYLSQPYIPYFCS